MQKSCPLLIISDYFKGDGLDKIHLNNRPYIAVCASSWTLDENMQLLFDALRIYDKTEAKHGIHVFITGKGPLRKRFIDSMKIENFQKIKIFSAWLSYEDYCNLLRIADFGISLHYSASGLDLPMKVIDYIGSELPTFSIRYECIEELVTDGFNGFLFDNAEEFAYLLTRHLESEPASNHILHSLAKNTKHYFQQTWESYWSSQVKRILLDRFFE